MHIAHTRCALAYRYGDRISYPRIEVDRKFYSSEGRFNAGDISFPRPSLTAVFGFISIQLPIRPRSWERGLLKPRKVRAASVAITRMRIEHEIEGVVFFPPSNLGMTSWTCAQRVTDTWRLFSPLLPDLHHPPFQVLFPESIERYGADADISCWLYTSASTTP